MSASPTVLIFTYSEYGQANSALATAYELALAGADVHIASFTPLKPRVLRLQELVNRHASRAGGRPVGPVSFHQCGALPSWREAVIKQGVKDASFYHPHGVFGALESYSMIETIYFPWSQEEYVLAIETCKDIIASVKPNVAVADPLFIIAHDACRLANQKFVILSPTCLFHYAARMQPYLAILWKYPIVSSGFPFPLEWWQIPLNIYLGIRIGAQLKSSARINEFRALRRSLGLKDPIHECYGSYDGVKYICPALAEFELPLAVIPEEVVLCGPIILPFDPLQETDSALTKWLDNGPTVMVNLGSLLVSDEKAVKETASALRILLDHHDRKGPSKLQVLWKAKTSEDVQIVIDHIIGKEVENGRVKVLPWLEVEPVSILQHPNVVCTVHHGGANSFYEGIWSGVPHIVLPVWTDTYEYATFAEFLNIGIFGNKTCAPSVQAEELSNALVNVTGDGVEAVEFRRSAKRLKDVCKAKGNGRELCSMAILKEAGVDAVVA